MRTMRLDGDVIIVLDEEGQLSVYFNAKEGEIVLIEDVLLESGDQIRIKNINMEFEVTE